MNFTVSACSIIGGRAKNQDNLLIDILKFPKKLSSDLYLFDPHTYRITEPYTFAICDGMGGKSDGEKASLYIVRELYKHLLKTPTGDDWKKINSKLVKRIPDSGSTCSLVKIFNNDDKDTKAIFQSIGDSYLLHYDSEDQTLNEMTLRDNKAALLENKGIFLPPEEKKYAEAVLCDFIGKANRDNTYHSNEITIKSGDVIIIASDGISNLTKEDIKNALFSYDFGKNPAFAIACCAVASNDEYVADNTTVIVLEFK